MQISSAFFGPESKMDTKWHRKGLWAARVLSLEVGQIAKQNFYFYSRTFLEHNNKKV